MSDQPQTDQPQDTTVQVGKYQVTVLRSQCISAGSCIAIAPDALEYDDKRIAVVKAGATDPGDSLLAAAQSCPTKAIKLFDTQLNQQVWPA